MRTDKEISELLELHYGIPTDPNLVEKLRRCLSYENPLVKMMQDNVKITNEIKSVGDLSNLKGVKIVSPTDLNLVEELKSCYLNKVVEHTPQDIFGGNCRTCGHRSCICRTPLGFFTEL